MTVRYKWNFPKFCYDCSPPHDPKWKNRELGPFMRQCSRMPRWHWWPSKEHDGMNNHNNHKNQTSNRRQQQQQQHKHHPHGGSVGDGDNLHEDLLQGSRTVAAAMKQVFGLTRALVRVERPTVLPMRWAEPPIHLERTHIHTHTHHFSRASSREVKSLQGTNVIPSLVIN